MPLTLGRLMKKTQKELRYHIVRLLSQTLHYWNFANVLWSLGLERLSFKIKYSGNDRPTDYGSVHISVMASVYTAMLVQFPNSFSERPYWLIIASVRLLSGSSIFDSKTNTADLFLPSKIPEPLLKSITSPYKQSHNDMFSPCSGENK